MPRGSANLRHIGAYEYRKKRAELKIKTKKEDGVCWICGKHFDWSDPHSPLAFTADHVRAVAVVGHMGGEIRPAHRRCNSARGAGRPRRLIHEVQTTRKW